LPQHLNRGIPVGQLAALGLRKAGLDVSGYRLKPGTARSG
jgi:hypothetical protein